MFRHDAKSLALFRAIHKKITTADPLAGGPLPYLRAAHDWAQRFSRERPEDIWLEEWVERLGRAITTKLDRESLYDLMLSNSQHAIDMRSSSPFAMVLTNKERTEVLLEFERQWREGTWDDRSSA